APAPIELGTPDGTAAEQPAPVGAPAAAALGCEELEAGYGSMQVLFGVDFAVQEGEIVALLGTNGAGKSTFFRAISNLNKPMGGKVMLGGTDITGMPTEDVARLGLGVMPGDKGIFPTLTVDENLQLAAWMVSSDKELATSTRAEILELFPILGQRGGQLA